MSKLIEIVALALGGLSLFAVAFVGFATMSGKPLSSTPGIGQLFPEGRVAGEDPGSAPVEAVAPRRSEAEVIGASIGMMGAWSLPSPYTPEELKELVDEIKGRLGLVEARERAVVEREYELDDEAQRLAERFEALESLQASLQEFAQELELREQEVLRVENTAERRERRKWSEVAGVLSSLDARVAGQRLSEYDPEEAAQILAAMPPETAGEIVNQVPERWKEYVDAYTRLASELQAE